MRCFMNGCLAGAIALFAWNSAAFAAGDVQAGGALAERWCASCHLVSHEQTSATTEAPPFASIAARAPKDAGTLQAFLASPHAPMPPISLSRQEIDDLLAYIGSLR